MTHIQNTNLLFTIIKYSHFFKIVNVELRTRKIINMFCSLYTIKPFVYRNPNNKFSKYSKFVEPPPKVYAANLEFINEYRFNKNQLDPLISFLKERYIYEGLYNIINAPEYDPESLNLILKPEWIKKDNQVPVVDYIVNHPDKSVCLTIRTGTGKTFCALAGAVELGHRLLILIKPSYMDKWVDDVLKIYTANMENIVTVQGSNQLKKIISLALADNLKYDVIIVSNKTHLAFINSYEDDPKFALETYGCYPEDLFPILKVGTIILDEIHQDFYGVYRSTLYTHVNKTISLSATLKTMDYQINKMYKMVYPMDIRFDDLKVENYIHVIGINYSFKDVSRIRTRDNGSSFYSHHAFEKSILKNPHILKNYKELIKFIVDIGYIDNYKRGDRLAIFVSSVNMATELTNYFKHEYKHLDVRRYVEEDPYCNVTDADIRITTIISAGTNIDIKNLTTVIQTINVLSQQSNLQTIGRLRDIKGRIVRFYYLYCDQIPKHRDYAKQRKTYIGEYIKSIKELKYTNSL